MEKFKKIVKWSRVKWKWYTRVEMEWEHRRQTIFIWPRVKRKLGTGKIQSMETWKKIGKYQENWN